MGTGDLVGDLGERWIAHPGIFKSLFRYRDGMGAAAPFAHQSGARLQTEAWIGSHLASGLEHLRQRLQLATCGLAEPAMLELLVPVADPPDQQVATNPWGFIAVKPSPFAADFIEAGAVQSHVRCLGGASPVPPRARASCRGPRHALSLGRRDRGNVVAAHPVFADVGDEGEVELLAHQAAEEAAYRMGLPTGLGDDVVDTDT